MTAADARWAELHQIAAAVLALAVYLGLCWAGTRYARTRWDAAFNATRTDHNPNSETP